MDLAKPTLRLSELKKGVLNGLVNSGMLIRIWFKIVMHRNFVCFTNYFFSAGVPPMYCIIDNSVQFFVHIDYWCIIC